MRFSVLLSSVAIVVATFVASIPGSRSPAVDTSEQLKARWGGYTTASGDSALTPITVFGQGGNIVSVNLNVPSGTTANRLWIKAHNLSYDNKGRVRVNGGAWTSFVKPAATCVGGEESLNGCFGTRPVIRFTVPATNLVNGTNLVEFEFTRGVLGGGIGADPGHGYRILELGALNAAGTRLDVVERIDRYPGDWTIAGQVGATYADSVAVGLTYLRTHTIPGGTATCVSCHADYPAAEAGWDLALFNPEPEAIMAACENRFGVGDYRCPSILAAIIDWDASTTVPSWPMGVSEYDVGRPWSLLMQPCDGVESRSAVLWMAGTSINNYGLDCVYDYDWQSGAEYAGAPWTATGRHKVLEQEQSLMFFDWLRWLPRVYLGDATTVFLGSQPVTEYAGFQADLQGGNMSAIRSGADDFWNELDAVTWNNADPVKFKDGTIITSIDLWHASRVYYALLWHSPVLSRVGELHPLTAQKYQWPGDIARTLFDVAPHIGGMTLAGDHENRWGTQAGQRNHYADHVWYEAQVVGNAGHTAQFRPTDWKYHYGHTRGYQARGDTEPTGGGGSCTGDLSTGYRQTRDAALNHQNAKAANDYYMRHLTLGWYFRGTNSQTGAITGCGMPLTYWNNNGVPTRDALATNIIRTHVRTLYDPILAGSLPRGGDYEFQNAGYIPNDNTFGDDDIDVGDTFVSVMNLMLTWNLSPTLMDSMATLVCDPAGLAFNYDCTPFELSGSAPTEEPVLTTPTNGALAISSTPTFTWTAVSGATSYDLEIDTLATFTNAYPINRDFNTTILTQEIIDRLLFDKQYFWRVRGKNSFGDGPWSNPTFDFTTEVDPNTWLEISFPGGACISAQENAQQQWTVIAAARAGLTTRRGALEGCLRTVDLPDAESATLTIDSTAGSSTSRQRTIAMIAMDAAAQDDPFIALGYTGDAIQRLRVVYRPGPGSPSAVQETVKYTGSIRGHQIRFNRTGDTFSLQHRPSVDSLWSNITQTYQLPGLSGTAKVGVFTSSGHVTNDIVSYFKFDAIGGGGAPPPVAGSLIPLDRTDLQPASYNPATDSPDNGNITIEQYQNGNAAPAVTDSDGDGDIMIAFLGFSNVRDEFNTFKSLYDGTYIGAKVANCGKSGWAVEKWISDGLGWTECTTAITTEQAGGTPDVIVFKLAHADTRLGGVNQYNLPLDNYEQLIQDCGAMIAEIDTRYPTADRIYLWSRTYGGYSNEPLARGEPISYETGLAVNECIRRHESATPGYTGTWTNWGKYVWADSLRTANDSGMLWAVSDFKPDGTHTQAGAGLGQEKVAEAWLAWLCNETWFDSSSCPAAPTSQNEIHTPHRINFTGPSTNETDATNPFLDYRLEVIFSHAVSGKSYRIPGFYAADGNAAETSAVAGDQWSVWFTPDETGDWDYTVHFDTGTEIAVDTTLANGTPTSFDGATGTVNVVATTKSLPDYRARGMVRSTPTSHYLRFADGTPYLKSGSGTPENFLAFADFDGTYDTGPNNTCTVQAAGTFIHSYPVHVADWNAGDPQWQGTKGRGIIGALNFLQGIGANNQYQVNYNIDGGDGCDLWPWIDDGAGDPQTERLRMDVSKLEQWDIIFSHMDSLGMGVDFFFAERENRNALDADNEPGVSRRLFYREMIARFGQHIAVFWNLGEEHNISNTRADNYSEYIAYVDGHNHPITYHTTTADATDFYITGTGAGPAPITIPQLTHTSSQIDVTNMAQHAVDIRAATSGDPWAVFVDEQFGQGITLERAAWEFFLAGGSGVSPFQGADQTLEDFNTVAFNIGSIVRARQFFETHLVPSNLDDFATSTTLASGGNRTFFEVGNRYATFFVAGGGGTIDLTGETGTWNVRWYNPRTGGALVTGTVATIPGGGVENVGDPPSETSSTWVCLVYL